jgi:hypothetical protein
MTSAPRLRKRPFTQTLGPLFCGTVYGLARFPMCRAPHFDTAPLRPQLAPCAGPFLWLSGRELGHTRNVSYRGERNVRMQLAFDEALEVPFRVGLALLSLIASRVRAYTPTCSAAFNVWPNACIISV